MTFWGPHSHPSAPLDVKFCTAKRTQVPVGPANFDLNRCNESPLRGEKPDFWPVSKNNTGSLPLRGILPVIRHIAAKYTYTFASPARFSLQPPAQLLRSNFGCYCSMSSEFGYKNVSCVCQLLDFLPSRSRLYLVLANGPQWRTFVTQIQGIVNHTTFQTMPTSM